jgi:hypothetical protein
LNSELHRKDLYNYSFTVVHSPYGEAYLNSIKSKVAESAKNGVFILTVDPWSISCLKEEADDVSRYREINLAVAKTKFVNVNPNLEYLVQFYEKPLVNLLKKQSDEGWLLHNDGWLEVTIPMDSTSVSKRVNAKYKEYREKLLPGSKPSAKRMKWLLRTIDFLKLHGNVFLVRLPVYKSILSIDSLLMPEFNVKMREIERTTTTPFLDLSSSNDLYQFTDGNHLHKQSSKAVSIKIADWIKRSIAEQCQ